MSTPDATFADPRLARLYDPMDPDRSDLDAYVGLVAELDARSVLDVGCGTGVLARLLAARGLEVVGVDPAAASLEVARAKPGADAVRWLLGDATTLPALQVDLATMTGNVAQVFVTESSFRETLRGVRAALRPGGHLVLETRDPVRRAWERWTRQLTEGVTDVPGVGAVRGWMDVVAVVEGPDGLLVTFESLTVLPDGTELPSSSTLRFPTLEQVQASLRATGLQLVEVRDAPDRPGLEHVVLARRAPG